VVHSADGLDEISLSAPTYVCEVRGSAVTCYDLVPEVLGLPAARLEELRVETAAGIKQIDLTLGADGAVAAATASHAPMFVASIGINAGRTGPNRRCQVPSGV
jgi:anthranilate phosphoribosyltransferase